MLASWLNRSKAIGGLPRLPSLGSIVWPTGDQVAEKRAKLCSTRYKEIHDGPVKDLYEFAYWS